VSREREWVFRINHILDAIEKIQRYTSEMNFEQFAGDDRTVDAVIRNFLVIGEATGRVPAEVRSSCTEIPWKLMEGCDMSWCTITRPSGSIRSGGPSSTTFLHSSRRFGD